MGMWRSMGRAALLALLAVLLGARAQEASPLHATVLAVFDLDKNGALTLMEVLSALDGFGALGAFGVPPAAGQPEPLAHRVGAAKAAAPTLFRLMDTDKSGTLTASELEWLGAAHERVKASLKELTREVFDAIDADGDNSVSPEEQKAAIIPPVLGKVTALLEANFPIPSLSSALEEAGSAEHVVALLALVDGDSNGAISRKEAYRAVSTFKRHFVEAIGMLETMGPMLAMLGDAVGGGVQGPGGGPLGPHVGASGSIPHNVKVARPVHEVPRKEEL